MNVIDRVMDYCDINNVDWLGKTGNNYRCVQVSEGVKKSSRGETLLKVSARTVVGRFWISVTECSSGVSQKPMCLRSKQKKCTYN